MIREVVQEDHEILSNVAQDILAPLYGDQGKAVQQWLNGEGFKRAFVYVFVGNIAGLLVLKSNKSKDYLKISTLVVLDGFKGFGIGGELLSFAESFAKTNLFRSIIVTVSEEKSESLSFFRKCGFVVIDSLNGKYQPGVVEHVLSKGVKMRTARIKMIYLRSIDSGEKTLECRINYPNLRGIKVGETIRFMSGSMSVVVQVLGIRKYQLLNQCLKSKTLQSFC